MFWRRQCLSTPDALHQAYGRIYEGLQTQAQTLANIDVFWMMAIMALCLIPLIRLLRRAEGKLAAHFKYFPVQLLKPIKL